MYLHFLSMSLTAAWLHPCAVVATAEEQALYLRAHADAAAKWRAAKAHGPSFVSTRLIAIMALLGPLRRICSGGSMSTNDIAVPDPSRLHPEAGGDGAAGAGGGCWQSRNAVGRAVGGCHARQPP